MQHELLLSWFLVETQIVNLYNRYQFIYIYIGDIDDFYLCRLTVSMFVDVDDSFQLKEKKIKLIKNLIKNFGKSYQQT